MAQGNPSRLDAVRNRGNIMEAAREQISNSGPGVGMAQIAKAAGVAVGTLYRHFPTKASLVGAIMAEHFAQIADDAEASYRRVVGGGDAFEELIGFLERVMETSASSHSIKAVAHTMDAMPGDPDDMQRAAAAVSDLIEHGQSEGRIHSDVTVEDIYLLISTAPMDGTVEARSRWLTLVASGLAASGRRSSVDL